MLTIYAAGPMTGLTWEEAREWRAELASLLGREYTVLSPLRGLKLESKHEVLKSQYEHTWTQTAKAIVARDRWDVQRCDVMVACFLGARKASIGTCIEFGWADAMRKPIVTIMQDHNAHDHSMIREMSSYVVPTIEAAASVITEMAL